MKYIFTPLLAFLGGVLIGLGHQHSSLETSAVGACFCALSGLLFPYTWGKI